MIDSIDQEIKISADDTGSADVQKSLDSFGKNANEAAQHATSLLNTIGALMRQLDNMDSDAARQLHNELAELAGVIKSLDVERLKDLDAILSSIDITGSKITGSGIEKIHDSLQKASAEAIKFKESFSNPHDVKVNIDSPGNDDIANLASKIELTANANNTIDDIDRISEKVYKIGENGKDASDKIAGIIEALKNPNVEGLVKLNDEFLTIKEIVASLPEDTKAIFNEIDFDIIPEKINEIRRIADTLAEGKAAITPSSGSIANARGASNADKIAGNETQNSKIASANHNNSNIGTESNETNDTAKHAIRLLKTISDLRQQLDGMDSDAAKQLRDDLAELANIINTLDVERLKYLDDILSSIETTGSKITGEGIEKVHENLQKANVEARKFKNDFINSHEVKLTFNFDDNDGITNFTSKLDLIGKSNDAIDKLEDLGGRLSGLGDAGNDATEHIAKIVEILKEPNADNIGEISDEFEKITKYLSTLSQDSRKAFAGIDFGGIVDNLQTIQDIVRSTRQEQEDNDDDGSNAIEKLSGIKLMQNAIKGNFEAIGEQFLKLIERTKTWQKHLKLNPAKAQAAMGAMAAGITTLIALGRKWLDLHQRDNREWERSITLMAKQNAETIDVNREAFDRTQRRALVRHQNHQNQWETRRINNDNLLKAAADLNLYESLEGNFSPEDNAIFTRDNERKKEDIDYARENEFLINRKADNKFNLNQATERKNFIDKAMLQLQKLSVQHSQRVNQVESEASNQTWWKTIKTYFKQVADEAGLGSFQDDAVAKVKDASDVSQYITEMMAKFREEQKDLVIDIEKLKEETLSLNGEQEVMDLNRSAQIQKRDTEDREYAQARKIENRQREWDREDREWDFGETYLSSEQHRRERIGGQYAGLVNARERQSKYEAELNEDRAALAEWRSQHKGMIENQISDADKAERDRLIGFITRDRRNLMNAKDAVFDATIDQGKSYTESAVEFQNKFNTGNRLVTMGLAGGQEYKWDEDTAKNTEVMVDLFRKLIDTVRDKPIVDSESPIGN